MARVARSGELSNGKPRTAPAEGGLTTRDSSSRGADQPYYVAPQHNSSDSPLQATGARLPEGTSEGMNDLFRTRRRQALGFRRRRTLLKKHGGPEGAGRQRRGIGLHGPRADDRGCGALPDVDTAVCFYGIGPRDFATPAKIWLSLCQRGRLVHLAAVDELRKGAEGGRRKSTRSVAMTRRTPLPTNPAPLTMSSVRSKLECGRAR